jgi:hypothetical protein
MLEYLAYALSLRWWPADAYAAEVLRNDGRLQGCDGLYHCQLHPWMVDRKYLSGVYQLTPGGVLLHRKRVVDAPPLRSFVPLPGGAGLGLSCRNRIVTFSQDTGSETEESLNALVVAFYGQTLSYLTPQGECWVREPGGKSYHVPLPFKPLAVCGTGMGGLLFLRPHGDLQRWYRNMDGTYTPGAIDPLPIGRDWALREVFVPTA